MDERAAAQFIQRATISHAVDLAAHSNWVVRRVMRLLNATDTALFAALRRAVEGLPAGEFAVARLDTLLAAVRTLNAQAYAAVGAELDQNMRALTEYEATFQHQVLRRAVPAAAAERVNAVSGEQAYAAALSRPMQGRLMRSWAQGLEGRRAQRISDSLAISYTQGATVAEAVRTLRGTRAAGYADGLMEGSRREVEAVARTAIAHVTAVAREQVFAANDGLISAVIWVSTLDTRTTPICQLRDGKRYAATEPHRPLGHSAEWLGGPGRAHWNCRSTSHPELTLGEALGFGAPTQRAAMNGPVSGTLTYADWLRAQPAARQDEVLGRARGEAFRARGGAEFERFFDRKGRLLTLEELRARDAILTRPEGGA